MSGTALIFLITIVVVLIGFGLDMFWFLRDELARQEKL
jgi:hypothetical protein